MTRFEKCIQFVIMDLEGGDKLFADSGGFTKWGISQRAYPDTDIEDLSYADACQLYLNDYWLPMGCDILPHGWDLAVFDCAVNQGVGAAAVLMQRALGVEDDGYIGPQTRLAMRQVKLIRLPLFIAKRASRYRSSTGFDKYGKGWLARLEKLCTEIAR